MFLFILCRVGYLGHFSRNYTVKFNTYNKQPSIKLNIELYNNTQTQKKKTHLPMCITKYLETLPKNKTKTQQANKRSNGSFSHNFTIITPLITGNGHAHSINWAFDNCRHKAALSGSSQLPIRVDGGALKDFRMLIHSLQSDSMPGFETMFFWWQFLRLS